MSPSTRTPEAVDFALKQCWPLGQNFCASGDDPSTCLWAAFGCKCEQWSPCAWLPLRAASMWRCSSSSARRSAVSLPVAHPACMTGPAAPPPTGRSPCNRGTFVHSHYPTQPAAENTPLQLTAPAMGAPPSVMQIMMLTVHMEAHIFKCEWLMIGI